MNTYRPQYPLILKSSIGGIYVPVSSIRQITAAGDRCELIHVNGDRTTLYHNIDDLAERLGCGGSLGDHRFFRTSRQCIAAVQHSPSNLGVSKYTTAQQRPPSVFIAPQIQRAMTICRRWLNGLHVA